MQVQAHTTCGVLSLCKKTAQPYNRESNEKGSIMEEGKNHLAIGGNEEGGVGAVVSRDVPPRWFLMYMEKNQAEMQELKGLFATFVVEESRRCRGLGQTDQPNVSKLNLVSEGTGPSEEQPADPISVVSSEELWAAAP